MAYFAFFAGCFILFILMGLNKKLTFVLCIKRELDEIRYQVLLHLLNWDYEMTRGNFYPFSANNPAKSEKRSQGVTNLFLTLLSEKKITYEKVSLNLAIGTGDVFFDAILYGGEMILLSTLPILFKIFLNVEKVEILVKPIFNKTTIELSSKCIVHIKIGDIICVYLERLRKGGDLDGASN